MAATGKRIVAVFHPQEWRDRRLFPVTMESGTPLQWDVTEEIVAMGEDIARAITDDSYEAEQLRVSAHAPQWIQDWNGPFEIYVEDSIAEYFNED